MIELHDRVEGYDDLRAALNASLSDIGGGLSSDGAPRLLARGRRRARRTRLAASVTGVAVIAATLAGLGTSGVISTAGGMLTPQPATGGGAATTRQDGPTAPVAGTPVVRPASGLHVLGQHSLFRSELLHGQVYNHDVYVVSRFTDGTSSPPPRTTTYQLDADDLRQPSGRLGLDSNFPGPVGGFTLARGIVWLAVEQSGRPAVEGFDSGSGEHVADIDLPAATGMSVGAQVVGTSVIGTSDELFVSTPSRPGITAFSTIDVTGRRPFDVFVGVARQQDVRAVGQLNGAAWFVGDDTLLRIRGDRITETALPMARELTQVDVTGLGLYLSYREPSSNQAHPTTFVLERRSTDGATVEASLREPQPTGQASTGYSVALLNNVLYVTDGTCPDGHPGACIYDRDVETLAGAQRAAPDARLTLAPTSWARLVQGTDGSAALDLTAQYGAAEQLDLLATSSNG